MWITVDNLTALIQGGFLYIFLLHLIFSYSVDIITIIMKRKLFVVLISFLIVAISATSIGLISWYLVLKFRNDDPQNKIHNHEYTVQSVREPTCTGQGYTTFICDCGRSYIGDYKSALGHSLNENNICTRCGFFQHEHEYEETVIEPTCTEQGYTKGKCIYCTAGFTAYYTDALGHDFADGKCTRCGQSKPSDGLIYTLSEDGTYYICSGGNNSIKNLIIASVYDGKPVREIGADAFDYGDIESVIIPDGITVIGHGAFKVCHKLKSVTIPSSLTKIDGIAFILCDQLADINFNGTIAQWFSIEKHTSWNMDTGNYTVHCTDGDVLKENDIQPTAGLDFTLSTDGDYYIVSGMGTATDTDIVIPALYNGKSVKKIGNGAFQLSQITSLSIPDGVTEIDERAFLYSSVTKITIPASVTSIGNNAFYFCSKLTDINFNGTKAQWNAIQRDDSLEQYATNCIIHCTDGDKLPSTQTKNDLIYSLSDDGAYYICKGLAPSISKSLITIPSDINGVPVREIAPSAFSNDNTIQSVTIYGNIDSIGEFAFSGCNYLTSINIAGSVKVIGNSAFRSCRLINNINIPDGTTSIGEYAFSGCEHLIIITLADSIEYIGSCAFTGCDNLKEIILPASLNSVSDVTFSGCSALTSVKFNDGLTSIGSSAFYSCENLTGIIIPDSVSSIGEKAFNYCENLSQIKIGKSVKTIGNGAFQGCAMKDIIIPDSVTQIDDYAFYGCNNLESIVIPDSVKTIGSTAFAYCKNLSQIEIGNGVTSIGNGAFRGCAIKSIIIPDSVMRLEDYAFYGCSNLESVTIPSGVTNFGSYTFTSCPNLTDIIYKGSMEEWEAIWGSSWLYLTNTCTVHCTDGYVTLNKK